MSPPNEPRPGQDLLRGEEDLGLALEDFRHRSGAHRDQVFEALEAAVAVPFRKAFSEALDAHTRLQMEAGLAGPGEHPVADPADPGVTEASRRGKRFRRYREGVRTDVLEPLRRSLRDLEIGLQVGSRWVGFQNGLPGLADPLPEVIVREEPEDIFGPRAGDGHLTTLRKGMIRAGRGTRESLEGFGRRLAHLMRRGDTLPPPRTQHVPLRPLARALLLESYPLSLRGVSDALQEHYAQPVAQLGTALARWTDDWFDAEINAQTAEGQLGGRFRDELLQGLPPRPQSQPDAPAEGEEEQALPVTEGETPTATSDPSELAEISLMLSEALQSGASLPPPTELKARVEQAMEREWENLLEAVRVAGSFMEAGAGKGTAARANRLLERDQAQAEVWQIWHFNTLERLLVATLLLLLREVFDQAEDGIQGRIVEEALSPLVIPWKKAMAELRVLEGQVDERFSGIHPGEVPSGLASELDSLRVQTQSFLESNLTGVLAQVQPDRVIHQIADEVSGKLSDGLRFLPDSVQVAPLYYGEGRLTPTQSVRELPFRETVHRTLDVLSMERIRNSPGPILSFLESAATECAELPNVVSYNMSMAADELRSPPDGSMETALTDARSLTGDGLTRTADWVEGLLHALADAWVEFNREVRRLLQKSFEEIHTRAVAEGAVEEQMLGLRAWAVSQLRAGADRGRVVVRWTSHKIEKNLRRGWVVGARLIRMGRSAVGVQVSQEGDTERALESIRQVPELLDSLPLVYRRLFSLNPIVDPNLLVGRDAEMAWVVRRLDDWRGGYGTPCILTGPVGVGHTSFLNVLEATKLREYQTHRLDLNERIRSEGALCTRIAATLGFSGDGPWTFSGLARRLEEAQDSRQPLVVLVEHIEQLFLRIPGGTDLIEDFLSFQALTANQVFWLSTTSGAGWKLVKKNEPRAAGLMADLPLTPLSRKDTEEGIMVRHRRSGLPLEFEHSTEFNPLIRRRLRLSRSEKAKQAIIRTDYFDRVFRLTGDSIALAMIVWLRSADFTSREGRLQVSPPNPLRFPFLEELDLSLDFALKAFLEHGSLTMEEYENVFGAPEEEAFQVFEALRNLLLIEPIAGRGGVPSRFEATKGGERYRVPPLLSQVVANHLKSRNILH